MIRKFRCYTSLAFIFSMGLILSAEATDETPKRTCSQRLLPWKGVSRLDKFLKWFSYILAVATLVMAFMYFSDGYRNGFEAAQKFWLWLIPTILGVSGILSILGSTFTKIPPSAITVEEITVQAARCEEGCTRAHAHCECDDEHAGRRERME